MVFGVCSGEASPREAWEEVVIGSGAAELLGPQMVVSF